MVLHHTMYPLMKFSTNYNIVFRLDKIIRNIYFHHFQWILISIKNIILKGHPILYILKQKDICDYNLRCLMSSVLVFYDIIMNIIRNKILECHKEEVYFFTNIENKTIYMYRGSIQDFHRKKVTYEYLDVPCVHFNVKIIQMKYY